MPEALASSTKKLSRNSIFSNVRLGIDLGRDGVNDPQTGPQQLPQVTLARSRSAGGTEISASMTTTRRSPHTVEFFANSACDPSNFGEGERFIGSITLPAFRTRSFIFPTVPVGHFVTATATDPNNRTSEFSRCFPVLPP